MVPIKENNTINFVEIFNFFILETFYFLMRKMLIHQLEEQSYKGIRFSKMFCMRNKFCRFFGQRKYNDSPDFIIAFSDTGLYITVFPSKKIILLHVSCDCTYRGQAYLRCFLHNQFGTYLLCHSQSLEKLQKNY